MTNTENYDNEHDQIIYNTETIEHITLWTGETERESYTYVNQLHKPEHKANNINMNIIYNQTTLKQHTVNHVQKYKKHTINPNGHHIKTLIIQIMQGKDNGHILA
jgi:hypothetical protein